VPDLKLPYQICVEAYGVHCVIRTNEATLSPKIRKTLKQYIPGCNFNRVGPDTPHTFSIKVKRSGEGTFFDGEGELLAEAKVDGLLEMLGSKVRITIAEFATQHVFIHSGVVGWKGKAIIIPGRSFKGKSALTAELIKIGARYYSDEYAVIDKRGLVTPFPKDLSLRGIKNAFEQVERSAKRVGGEMGKRAIPIGLVLISEYVESARWNPKEMNSGKGMLELINNCVSIRQNPKFVIPVLSRAAANARFCAGRNP